MANEVQIAAYEGGALRMLSSGEQGREVVLALPLSRLLVKMVRVPVGSDPMEFSEPILKAISPFPDDPLTVSCEKVREDEQGSVVIAAALPEGAADDIGEALDAAKLNVVRIDAMVLGELRGVWREIQGDGRRLVVFRSPDCLSLVVLDGDEPSAIRAVSDAADFRREAMLSLLEAEDFGGSKALREVVLVRRGEVEAERPEVGFDVPVREIAIGDDAGLVGVAERAEDEGALNALPESWHEVLLETRFKAKLVRNLAVALGLWALVMGVLFGVPVAYGFMTDHQKDLCKQHARQYNSVKEKKAKTEVVRKYSDHRMGALETMKAVSDCMPEGVTLSSWDFKREETDEGARITVRMKGEAESSKAVREFKNELDALEVESLDGSDEMSDDAESSAFDEDPRRFKTVKMGAINASKDGSQRFDFDCRSEGPKEEGD